MDQYQTWITVKSPDPSESDQYQTWITESAMFMAWLINSMKAETGQIYPLHSAANETWDAGAATYSNHGNNAQAFDIKNFLKDVQQNSIEVTSQLA